MPRLSKLARSQSLHSASTIASTPLLFLPNTFLPRTSATDAPRYRTSRATVPDLTKFFFSSLAYASSCDVHRTSRPSIKKRLEQWSGHPRSIGDARADRKTQKISSATGKQVRIRKIVQLQNSQDGSTFGAHPSAKRTDSEPGKPGFFDSSTQKFAKSSTLPLDFYNDLERVAGVKFDKAALHVSDAKDKHDPAPPNLLDQMQLLQSVRELEEKLSKARAVLDQSLKPKATAEAQDATVKANSSLVLTKQDYLNLVDLYYYSYQSRSEPGSPDFSPTPLILDQYSFELSRDFRQPTDFPDIDEEDVSPLKDIEEMLKSRQLKEITLMQAFVDLLLDEKSSNRALYEVYQLFPQPGVAYLPTGILRIFLQRMSTPWQKSGNVSLRYLSLVEDMQKANLRITNGEWSSAIYLAGRAFSRVTESDVSKSFGIWREMEESAGVQATHVTFNILFDIAVRADKHALAQSILAEMQGRGLRLNRLGRVSMIYYHGMRGDGDGVRRTYRDFIEAGEIVDTLVLNCVMASLIRAQEPVAAEQIYERMKQLQTRLRRGTSEDDEGQLFMKYPPPGSTQIEMQMASNSLGRVLLGASHLREILPDHHQQLQAIMPLTPDHITFRSLISHHAGTSGDLDRLTVLLNDKTDLFGLPLTSLDFQLLFKGFAVHGATFEEGKWTKERLQLVWDACKSFIKATQKRQQSQSQTSRPQSQKNNSARLKLPSIKDVDSGFFSPSTNDTSPQFKTQTPDAWSEFVLDLAAYPRERPKRHIPMSNAFFPEDADPSTPSLDQHAEYSLPDATSLHHQRDIAAVQHDVDATRGLIVWLIRAHARCTGSRKRIEEVWFDVRKLWTPRDQEERSAVVKCLRKALKDCDHSGVMR